MDLEIIRIEFKENEEEILHLSLLTQPFKVDESIQLVVENKYPDHWDVKAFEPTWFKITKIDHQVHLSYAKKCHQYVNTTIHLTRIHK